VAKLRNAGNTGRESARRSNPLWTSFFGNCQEAVPTVDPQDWIDNLPARMVRCGLFQQKIAVNVIAATAVIEYLSDMQPISHVRGARRCQNRCLARLPKVLWQACASGRAPRKNFRNLCVSDVPFAKLDVLHIKQLLALLSQSTVRCDGTSRMRMRDQTR